MITMNHHEAILGKAITLPPSITTLQAFQPTASHGNLLRAAWMAACACEFCAFDAIARVGSRRFMDSKVILE
jgi:hypothetical protein